MTWNAPSQYAGYQDGEESVSRLLGVDKFNRMRTTVLALDADDSRGDAGICHLRSATRSATLATLRRPLCQVPVADLGLRGNGGFVAVA